MTINSAFRTVAQQYLLYAWYQQGRCGIGLAAIPGNSNHEQGLAVDIDDNGGWNSYMTKQGFQWFGNADPVHFDYVGGGAVNQKGFDVEAFQRLWNRNHANDTIAVDGSYGPETEKRLVQSPIGGFKIGAICNMMPPPDAGTDSGSPKPDSGAMNPPSPDAGAMPSTPDPMQTNDPGPQQQQPQANGCSSAPGSPSPSIAGALFVLLLLARRKR